MKASVLVIDDDCTLSRNITTYLARNNYRAEAVSTGTDAKERVEKVRPDFALIDLLLPDMSGMDLLQWIRSVEPQTVVIMMTGAGSVQVAVDAMKAGADDYLSKPLVLKQLKLLLDRTAKEQKLQSVLSYYHDREAVQSGFTKIVGDSVAIREIKTKIALFLDAEKQLADQQPPTVLITGETGCGKELVARAFHFEGSRRGQPFVQLNCASIPPQLLEAELFGYERGAFTDARQRKIGLIDAANGGTLFLDEIAEMDLGLQAKLLTLLESRRVRRLGSVQEHDVDVRIIAATNQEIADLAQSGGFRSDLYYRLCVVRIHVPPLRERGRDVSLLTKAFLIHHAERYRKPMLKVRDAAMEKLIQHTWPGNVRELRNTLEQAVLLCRGDEILPEHILIGPAINGVQPSVPTRSGTESLNLQENEIRLIRRALERSGGNVTHAAELLGLSRDTLRYRMRKYRVWLADQHGG